MPHTGMSLSGYNTGSQSMVQIIIHAPLLIFLHLGDRHLGQVPLEALDSTFKFSYMGASTNQRHLMWNLNKRNPQHKDSRTPPMLGDSHTIPADSALKES